MAPSYKGFDQILTEYVGGRGRYQLKITLLMTPLYWLTFPLLFLIVFSAYVPPHRCKVSACENITEKVSFYNLYGSQISKYLGKESIFRSLQTSLNLNGQNLLSRKSKVQPTFWQRRENLTTAKCSKPFLLIVILVLLVAMKQKPAKNLSLTMPTFPKR